MIKHVYKKEDISKAPVDIQPVEGDDSGLYVELTSKRYFEYVHTTFEDVKAVLKKEYNAEPCVWDTHTKKILIPNVI